MLGLNVRSVTIREGVVGRIGHSVVCWIGLWSGSVVVLGVVGRIGRSVVR